MNGSHSPINSNSVDQSVEQASVDQSMDQLNLADVAATTSAPTPDASAETTHPHHGSAAAHTHQHAHAHTHPHSHDPESLKQIINRLSRIEGHIRGVKNMVQENQPCPDVLIQIAAIRGALNRVSRMILDAHLTDCIVRAAETGTIETEIDELKSALDRFLP